MDLDLYFKSLLMFVDNFLCELTTNDQLSVEVFWERELEATPEKQAFVEFAKNTILSQDELKSKRGFLSIGYFKQYQDEDFRLTCFYICDEINSLKTLTLLKKQFDLYNPNQPLFKESPSVISYVYKKELFDCSTVDQIDKSEVVKINNVYSKIDCYLDPLILHWTISSYPNSKTYVRINPLEVYQQQPLYKINEDVMVPPNPYWIGKLAIHQRKKEGASYFLRNVLPCENMDMFMEYNNK